MSTTPDEIPSDVMPGEPGTVGDGELGLSDIQASEQGIPTVPDEDDSSDFPDDDGLNDYGDEVED